MRCQSRDVLLSMSPTRCGVNERTLRRWLSEDAEFKAEYDAARKATYAAGIARIQALTGKGVETLEELLDAKEFPAVRLGAARTVVELGIHRTTRKPSCASSRKSKRASCEEGGK